MTIGQRINKARIERGLTIDKLAEIANISRNTIVSWIYRGIHPDIDYLIVVADVFDMSLDELVGRKMEEKK